MARASGSYPECHRFESSRRYHRGAHGAPEPYGPLVKWLRHRPFTAVTWVRIPYGSPDGGLAQQVRAPASHAGGHWFESSSLHQGTAAERKFCGCVFLFPYANFARWCAHFTRLLFWRSKWCIFRSMHYGGECLNETQPAYRFARIGAHRLSAARWCLGRRAGTARLQRRRYHHHR